MKKRIVALSVPAVAIALVLAGCGSSSSKTSNKVLNTTAQANVETVDPNRVTDVGSDLAVTQTVEGLYKQNNKGKIVASVAKKIVKPTDNGKVYTFNLKKTKWSDGSAVTAQDFVASFRRQVEPKTKSQRANHLEDLVVSKYGEQAFLTWNNYNTTAKNTNLRRAISYSLNRKTLASDVLKDGSQAAKSIVPSGEVKGSNGKDFNTQVGNGLAYNSTKAKYYFKLAQQELGKKKITIQLLTADTDAYKSVGEYIQAQAQKVLPGLKITIKSIPLEQEITAFSDHNYQFGTLGWSTDFPDPIDYLNIAAKGGEINFTNWTNAKYQKVIDQINDTKNQTSSQRVKLQQKAAKILNTEQGVTPLYQYASVHLVSSDLKGLSYPLIGYQKYEYVSWK